MGDPRTDGVDDARTGVLPHLTRLARELATTRGARSLISEARGLGTHILHYPLGVTRGRVRPTYANGNGQAVDRIHDTPVALVHGYFHNRSGFDYLSRQLRSARLPMDPRDELQPPRPLDPRPRRALRPLRRGPAPRVRRQPRPPRRTLARRRDRALVRRRARGLQGRRHLRHDRHAPPGHARRVPRPGGRGTRSASGIGCDAASRAEPAPLAREVREPLQRPRLPDPSAVLGAAARAAQRPQPSDRGPRTYVACCCPKSSSSSSAATSRRSSRSRSCRS